MSNLKPKRGAIATCSAGSLGIITVNEPKEITYSDGTSAEAWVGIHLTDKVRSIGDGWSSRNPEVLGYIEDLPTALQERDLSEDQSII